VRRVLIGGLLCATLLLSACGGGDDGSDAAATSIPERTTTSSTTTEPRVPPPDVIPRDPNLITEEYVEQVLDALYEVSLEAVELARTEGVVTPSVIGIAQSIRSPDHALEAVNALITTAAEGFPGYRDDPGPTTADVRQLLVATPECLFAEVSFDSSQTFTSPPSVPDNLRSFVRLLPASQEQRGSGLNPTAWVIDGLPFSTDGSSPETGC